MERNGERKIEREVKDKIESGEKQTFLSAFSHRFPLLILLSISISCGPPKYVSYTGIHKDFKCMVPWGWNVITDQEGHHYENTDFLGPFDGRFYLGIPSLSVRWYSDYAPHLLRDGSIEIYADGEDYIHQMLNDVYGPQRIMLDSEQDILLSGNRKAKYFRVLSPVPVPKNTPWGASKDTQTGQLVNLREHSYVVVPMESGFYVLIYPATHAGYHAYRPAFDVLVNTFVPLTDGPGGPRVPASH